MARILIGVDGSELARRAARQAVELFGAAHDVTVAEVVRRAVPVAAVSGMAITAAAVDTPAIEETNRALVHEAEAHVAAAARELGATARTEVVFGEPGPELCRLAAEGGYHVVVVGSHGSGFLKRVLLGSVSHHVLHHAPCAVLVVRERESTGRGAQ